MTEQWLPVVGWEGLYEVSDMGRVRSLDRQLADGRRVRGRVLRPGKAGDKGYQHVNLTYDGKPVTAYIHALVAAAFIGPRPPRQEVCHNDSDTGNNWAINLRYDTSTGNKMDRVLSGRDHYAARPACKNKHTYTEETTRWRKRVTKDGEERYFRVCVPCMHINNARHRPKAVA